MSLGSAAVQQASSLRRGGRYGSQISTTPRQHLSASRKPPAHPNRRYRTRRRHRHARLLRTRVRAPTPARAARVRALWRSPTHPPGEPSPPLAPLGPRSLLGGRAAVVFGDRAGVASAATRARTGALQEQAARRMALEPLAHFRLGCRHATVNQYSVILGCGVMHAPKCISVSPI